MINELRTLLLNRSNSENPGPAYPGEEFVPTNYMVRTLTDGLTTVYQLLFGVVPDRALLNFRLRELMSLIHSTELSEFVYALDPRVTYWPPRNNSLYSMLSNVPIIVKVVGTKDLYVENSPPPFTDNEQLYYSYLIDVVDGSHVSVQPTTIPVPPTTYTYTVTSGLSSLVQLPGTTIQFRFQAGVGSQWTVTWLSYPAKTLTNVYNDLISNLTDDLVNDLFGERPSEPLLTLRNLWLESPYPPYKIGAVATALGYQINNLVV